MALVYNNHRGSTNGGSGEAPFLYSLDGASIAEVPTITYFVDSYVTGNSDADIMSYLGKLAGAEYHLIIIYTCIPLC